MAKDNYYFKAKCSHWLMLLCSTVTLGLKLFCYTLAKCGFDFCYIISLSRYLSVIDGKSKENAKSSK